MAAVQPSAKLMDHVGQLRGMAGADLDAILSTLENDQRQRVLALLRRMENGEPSPQNLGDPVLALPADLSGWLVARLNGMGDAGEETADQFTMTTLATRELRKVAALMVPQPVEKSRSSTSLLGRLWPRGA